jgi:hypothetical protein
MSYYVIALLTTNSDRFLFTTKDDRASENSDQIAQVYLD